MCPETKTSPNETDVVQLRIGRELFTWPQSDLDNDAVLARQVASTAKALKSNPLQFFAPHGEAKIAEDGGFQLVSAVDYLNDDTHSVCMNKAPNRTGKTCMNVVKGALRICRCNPKWLIFREHGVKCPDWDGPKTLLVMGYDQGFLIRVLWPELQKWLPDYELGAFRSPQNGGTRHPSWSAHPMITLAKSKSTIIFLNYDQSASVGAGVLAHYVIPDEQMPLSFFNEIDERGRTIGGIKWYFGYTPHKVDGRPDSGADSFLEDMWSGRDTRGHSVLRMRCSIDEVPDYIYSREQKQAAYRKWVEGPEKTGDTAAKREGLARYYGIAQQPADLFYPEFNRLYHVIHVSWEDLRDRPGRHFRYMDYGHSAPTVCLFCWMSNFGDVVIYDEYYVKGKDAYDHAAAIIERSGNSRRKGDVVGPRGHAVNVTTYEEVSDRQRYERTVLDHHCFEQPSGGGITVAQWFRMGGLPVITSTTADIIPRSANLRMLFRINQDREHFATKELGAPRLYISDRCEWSVHELLNCRRAIRKHGEDQHNPKETRQEKNDHAIDAMEYMACDVVRMVTITPRHMKISDKSARRAQKRRSGHEGIAQVGRGRA